MPAAAVSVVVVELDPMAKVTDPPGVAENPKPFAYAPPPPAEPAVLPDAEDPVPPEPMHSIVFTEVKSEGTVQV